MNIGQFSLKTRGVEQRNLSHRRTKEFWVATNHILRFNNQKLQSTR